ncbi:MAG: hypothetical protein QOC66_815 [Pseudonocardiales bacterium]|jgi:hypothetical protein|nr:hypothetical protein [Pseudonocardiales bacterium]
MTEDTNDGPEAEIERELGRFQAQEREELTEHLEQQFQTDERIIQAIAGDDRLDGAKPPTSE